MKYALGYKEILRLAIPVILANATQPLLGLADTAVIGHSGSASDLGGIALGTLIFSFLYWGFGFLRMGTTGFVAQAHGAEDHEGIRAAIARALLLAVAIGGILIVAQVAVNALAFYLLDGSHAVHQAGQAYFSVRIWGAPSTLINYVIFGTLIGLSKTRTLLLLQLLLNGLNIALDVFFVLQLDLGVKGVALGTILAQYTCTIVGLWIIYRSIRAQVGQQLWPWPRIMQSSGWKRTVSTNADIMWRTLFLLGGFAWFTNEGARFGDDILAANDVLLQLVSFATFFLDGFSYVVEALVGQTLGAGRPDLFRLTLKRTTILSGGTALALAIILWLCGGWILHRLAPIASVVEVGSQYMPLAALYIALSFGAYILDGVFIGATRGPQMRNAAIVSTSALVLISLWWIHLWANTGLWLSFCAFVVIRALTLLAYMPALMRETGGHTPSEPCNEL